MRISASPSKSITFYINHDTLDAYLNRLSLRSFLQIFTPNYLLLQVQSLTSNDYGCNSRAGDYKSSAGIRTGADQRPCEMSVTLLSTIQDQADFEIREWLRIVIALAALVCNQCQVSSKAEIYPMSFFHLQAYHYLTTIDEEVKYIWPQPRWKLGRILFLTTRYCPLILVAPASGVCA